MLHYRAGSGARLGFAGAVCPPQPQPVPPNEVRRPDKPSKTKQIQAKLVDGAFQVIDDCKNVWAAMLKASPLVPP
jgi:hypothetical protein